MTKKYNLIDAYSDCNELSKEERNLDYRAEKTYSLPQLVKLFRQAIPDGYNEFHPDYLQQLAETFGDDARYRPGREGSPVIYVKPKGRLWIHSLENLRQELCIDEVSLEVDGKTVRLWWD
jgi:hypothetical protein